MGKGGDVWTEGGEVTRPGEHQRLARLFMDCCQPSAAVPIREGVGANNLFTLPRPQWWGLGQTIAGLKPRRPVIHLLEVCLWGTAVDVGRSCVFWLPPLSLICIRNGRRAARSANNLSPALGLSLSLSFLLVLRLFLNPEPSATRVAFSLCRDASRKLVCVWLWSPSARLDLIRTVCVILDYVNDHIL